MDTTTSGSSAQTYRPDLITRRVVYNITAGASSYDYSMDTYYLTLLNVVD